MGHPVVSPAQQDQVVQGRVSAVGPMHHVVGVAPAPRCPAAGDRTPPVADHQGEADTRRDNPGGSSYIQRLRTGAGDHPGHPSITGQHPCLGGGDHTGLIQLTGTTRPTLQRLERDVDHHMRTLQTLQRQITVIKAVPAQIHQGVGAALCRAPSVGGVEVPRVGESLEGGDHHLTRHWIQPTIQVDHVPQPWI